MRLLILTCLLLTACTGPGSTPAEPAPEGQWRGTLTPLDGAGRSLPATLSIRGGSVGFIAGSARANGSDAETRGGRLVFSVEAFPITPTLRRTLRCSLANDGPQTWDGTCRAGTATYNLSLVRSAM